MFPFFPTISATRLRCHQIAFVRNGPRPITHRLFCNYKAGGLLQLCAVSLAAFGARNLRPGFLISSWFGAWCRKAGAQNWRHDYHCCKKDLVVASQSDATGAVQVHVRIYDIYIYIYFLYIYTYIYDYRTHTKLCLSIITCSRDISYIESIFFDQPMHDLI